MQKTQPKPLRLARFGQTDQQISDQLVLIAEQRTVAIARLAHAESTACQSNANPLMFYGIGGHLATMRWPAHFFPRASFSRSACMLRSANIRFSRQFSSSKFFIWLIIDTSPLVSGRITLGPMPSYLNSARRAFRREGSLVTDFRNLGSKKTHQDQFNCHFLADEHVSGGLPRRLATRAGKWVHLCRADDGDSQSLDYTPPKPTRPYQAGNSSERRN